VLYIFLSSRRTSLYVLLDPCFLLAHAPILTSSGYVFYKQALSALFIPLVAEIEQTTAI
jgi:hypothetical protein